MKRSTRKTSDTILPHHKEKGNITENFGALKCDSQGRRGYSERPLKEDASHLRNGGKNMDTKHTKIIVIRATLDWFTPVWRDIAISDNQTLITLHRTIQRAFQWDNDHLYAFFMSGREWDSQDSMSYSEPTSLREEGASHPNERSARVKLRALHLRTGQKIAYVYDYGDNLSVNLVVRRILDAASGIKCPRVIALRGFSPPEENYHEGYTRRINKELKKGLPKIIKLESKTETEILEQWSDIPEE